MTRPKTLRKVFSNSLELDLWMELERLSIHSRIPKNALMDEAVTDLVEKHKAKGGF